MRHSEFHINLAAHDAWLKAMRAAVDGVEMKPEHKEQLWGYLEMAAAAIMAGLPFTVGFVALRTVAAGLLHNAAPLWLLLFVESLEW